MSFYFVFWGAFLHPGVVDGPGPVLCGFVVSVLWWMNMN